MHPNRKWFAGRVDNICQSRQNDEEQPSLRSDEMKTSSHIPTPARKPKTEAKGSGSRSSSIPGGFINFHFKDSGMFLIRLDHNAWIRLSLE